MDYQTEFEQTKAYDAVKSFISNPTTNRKTTIELDNTLLSDVDSLSEMEVEETEDGVRYYVETDTNNHFYVAVIFEDGELDKVRVDVGAVAAPLAGKGYSWQFTPDGEIEHEGPWIS